MAKKIVYDTKQIGAIAEIFSAAELGISDVLDTQELSYKDIAAKIKASEEGVYRYLGSFYILVQPARRQLEPIFKIHLAISLSCMVWRCCKGNLKYQSTGDQIFFCKVLIDLYKLRSLQVFFFNRSVSRFRKYLNLVL